MRVYADYGATTPVDPRVLDAMRPYFSEEFGNAGSVHAWGQRAREAVDVAREQVARVIGASPSEVVFTSGATESDNFAVWGAALANEDRGRHLVVSAVEHHAVLEPCRFLESRGYEVTYVPVDRRGRVDPPAVGDALRTDTVLVSVMHANNEIGTMQPVAEIGRLVRARGILMHADAAQTAGIVPVDVDALSVDLLSLSAHKRYGPKGVGALYVRTGARVSRVQHGGAHERNRRAGTENVPGIVGFGAALGLASTLMTAEAARLRNWRDHLRAAIEEIPGAHVHGDPEDALPGTVSVSFEGTDSESLLMALDFRGIAASSGSACTSGSLEPSHVLRAISVAPALARGTVRLSLGRGTTDNEVVYLIAALTEVVRQIRQ